MFKLPTFDKPRICLVGQDRHESTRRDLRRLSYCHRTTPKSRLGESGLAWARVVSPGREWSRLGESGLAWARVVSPGRELSRLGESCLAWARNGILEPVEAVRFSLERESLA
ncbi:hypothetical protein Lal_00018642 [Lupinus albus]|nr:hypothetical protein Lal_00018642 [Lupinus albus]